ncbi:ArgE/DapE family deacylase [Kaistia dalseonensis]|uniref:Acetylornithine deacetylase n=1 Tax=Kaistia dalseonensis TaxID=410840 RepID=A0ABU0HDP4_9HYPH|nr:ArgE/DapE family deacylase [Kaistia dalseonensis]MCX5497791.1 ArgE/DapE family deacylase [Kaistia dalseonensis]MDQ0440435.1 acetylornithine deacetylase [Kaistia dalseonensis]
MVLAREALLDGISAAVDGNWDRQIEWLKRLVEFPSTRGNEGPCQDWLASEFARRNWSVDRFTIDEVPIEGKPGYSPAVDVDYSKAVQVVATCRAEEPTGRSLILQGHIDVVPPGPLEQWDHPPFEPHIADGFMHGRGANDMKVGVASMVFALDALRDLGLQPAADVFVETVSEEECTGNGALATLVRGYRADACLIPEALDNKLLRAELGSVWFRVRILGKPVHVLQAQAGASAILTAYDYIGALQALTARINERAKSHPWFGHIDNPVKFSCGKIRGGDWLGSVPAWCEIECRLSVLPGDALADVRSWVIEAVEDCARRLGNDKAPEVTWIGFQADGHVFHPGTDAEAVLAEAHKAVFGTALETFSQTATSDTRQYDLYYGIPTLCYGSCGSGSHSAAERTDLVSMRETTKAIALFIAEWCGVRPLDARSAG